MPAPRIATDLIALISRFANDSRANLAVIFALALIPLLAAVGCATEYSLTTQMRAKMQAAADVASIASISRNSPGYLAATQMTSDGPVSAGVIDANNVFKGNLGTTGGDGNVSVVSTVIKSGATLISNVRFSAEVATAFMKIVGNRSLTISGSSTASAGIPPAPINMVTQRNNMLVLRNGMFNQQNNIPNQQNGTFNQPRMTARIVK
jgi:Flp pilus assembly protein TadG